MKIRLSKDEIKSIVLASLQASMPNISEKDVVIDNDGITVNTSLGDALGINLTAAAPTRTRRKKMVIEDATPVTTTPAPEPELEEEDEPVEADLPQEDASKSDNSVTAILEGTPAPKGLFDD